MYRGSRGKGRGPIFDRRNIEARLRTRSEETERAQREEMEQRAQIEEMEQRAQREKEIAVARGLPTNRGRGPGRWNTAGERLNMLAASEAPVPEYVPGAAAAASAAPEQEISQEERVRAHIKYMEDLRKRRPPPPIQYTDPSDYYKNYRVSDTARNFPSGHDYTRPGEARPVITLSPEAKAYEESEVRNANLEELGNRMVHSVMDGQGGRKKRKTANIRQKKQRRRRRRHSTKKYRK